MSGGGPISKASIINFVVKNPVQVYLAGGVFLLSLRRM